MSNKYVSTLNYTEVDRDSIVSRIESRLTADGFGNLLDSKKISLLVDIFGEATDLILYYLERRAEENYYTTSRLESTAASLANSYGYSMRRPVPSKAPLSITLSGKSGTPNLTNYEITFPMFSRVDFNGLPFLLDKTYVYVVTSDDELSNADFSKTFTFAVLEDERYVLKTEADKSNYETSERYLITAIQGEFRTVIFDYLNNPTSGEIFQRYVINDPEFSNFFGTEDPNAYAVSTGEYNLNSGFTKVSVTFPHGDVVPFTESSLYTIDRRSLISHETLYRDTWDKFYDENGNLIEDNIPKTVVIRTERDGGVSLLFGDGLVSAYPSATQDINVQYLATRGAKANKIGVTGETMNLTDNIFASGSTGVFQITDLVALPLTGNIVGGSDLEDIESVRVNAPSVFNSFDRLIGKSDYISFLRNLTTPIIVRQAIAWGENEEVKSSSLRAIKRFSNHVFYSAIGSMYYTREDGTLAPKVHNPNPATPDEESLAFQNGTYAESFDFDVMSSTSLFNALVADRVVEQNNEEFKVYKTFFDRTVGEDYTEQQVEMVDRFPQGHPVMLITTALDKRAQMTVHHQYISPIIQQFFLDGEIVIRDFADISTVRARLDSVIYQYLDKSINFNTPIYISQIVDLVKSDPDVSFCNVKFSAAENTGELIADWEQEPEFNGTVTLEYSGIYADLTPLTTNTLEILTNGSGFFDEQSTYTATNFTDMIGKVVRVSKDNGATWQYTEIVDVSRSQSVPVTDFTGFITAYQNYPVGEGAFTQNGFQMGAVYIVASPYLTDASKIGQFYQYATYSYVNGTTVGPDIYTPATVDQVARDSAGQYWQFNGTTWVAIAELPYIYTLKIDTSKIGDLDPTSTSTMIEIVTNFADVYDELGFQPKYYLIEGFREAIRKEVQRLFDIVLQKECSCPTVTVSEPVDSTQLVSWYGKCVPLSVAKDFMPRETTDDGPCRQVTERINWYSYYGNEYIRSHASEYEDWTHCRQLSVLTTDEILSGAGNSGLDIAQFTKVVAAQYPWKDGAPTTNGWATEIKIHHRIGGITERWFWTVLARNIVIELRRIANYRNKQVQNDFYTTDRDILGLFLGEFGTTGDSFNLSHIQDQVASLLQSQAYIEDLDAISNTEKFISSKSIRGLLKKLHNGMSQSIRNGMLDMYGNIVNYSLPNEIVQVKSRVTIKYRGGV